MSRWFRVYDEILDDPKVQLLSPELFKTWVNLLALASRLHGKLPPVAQIAFALRISVVDAQTRIDDLILAGLLDVMPDRSVQPHNWHKRQWKSDDSADRVRRHRNRQRLRNDDETLQPVTCNGDVTVTVTPPDTETETEADTETKTDTDPRGDRARVRDDVKLKDGTVEIGPDTAALLGREHPGCDVKAVAVRAAPELVRFRNPTLTDKLAVLRRCALLDAQQRRAPRGQPKRRSALEIIRSMGDA